MGPALAQQQELSCVCCKVMNRTTQRKWSRKKPNQAPPVPTAKCESLEMLDQSKALRACECVRRHLGEVPAGRDGRESSPAFLMAPRAAESADGGKLAARLQVW